MALNPALVKMVAAARAKYEDDDEKARELLLNLIGNTLERIHFTPTKQLVDYPQEAMDLLEGIEAWAVASHRDGYLISRDPGDDIERL